MAGVALFLGGGASSLRAVLQVPDHAWRMSATAFRRAARASPGFRQVLSRYVETLIAQVAHSARCGQVHKVDARCARWLLMAHDRVGRDRFMLTQAFLGQMLGVQRSTVSSSAGRLQARGLIEYARGRVDITNRGGLEAASCNCYAIVEAQYRTAFAR
jgi:CRP-like cAMP-binding protein